MNKKILVTILGVYLSIFTAKSQPYSLIDFEGTSVPNYCTASDNNSLSITQLRRKYGNQSMLWEWDANDTLAFDNAPGMNDVVYKNNRRMVLFWIYNDNPLPNEKLTLRAGMKDSITNGKGYYQFDFYLNFKGWRSMIVVLKEDATWTGAGSIPSVDDDILNYMDVIAPSNGSGNLFFDFGLFYHPSFPNDTRTIDLQTPYLDVDPKERWQKPFYALQYTPKWPLPPYSQTLRNDVAAFTDRANFLVENNDGYNESAAIATLNALNITKNSSGILNGTTVFAAKKNRDSFEKNGISDFVKVESVLEDCYLYLAKEYLATRDTSFKEKYIQLCDYLNDQGWAYGSNMMSQHRITNADPGHTVSLYLMRNDLDTERWNREVNTVKWISAYNELYNNDTIQLDADQLKGGFLRRIVILALLPQNTNLEVQKKARDIMYFKHSIEQALRVTRGHSAIQYGGTIVKPDYTTNHNDADYLDGNTSNTMNEITYYQYLLHDTSFDLDSVTKSTIANIVEKTFIKISSKHGMGPVLRGREANIDYNFRPFTKVSYLAASGYESMKPWLKYYMNTGQFKPKSFLKNSIQRIIDDPSIPVAETPSGNWTLNYATLNWHRRDSWIVAIRGHSAYIPSPEIFPSDPANSFGQFMGHGRLQILGIDGASEMGTSHIGIDWTRFSGTTAIHYDIPTIRDMRVSGKRNGWSNDINGKMNGGMSHFNRNGIYHLKLAGRPGFDDGNRNFKAHKSYFFFDNTVVCIGSNIQCDNGNFPVGTTLFQVMATDRTSVTTNYINGDTVKKMDGYGNGYVIPNAQNLKYETKLQQSRNKLDDTDEDGHFSTLYINHGKAVNNDSYTYAILVQQDQTALYSFNFDNHFNIHQQDSVAHIIEYMEDSSFGYVFNQHVDTVSAGPIRSIDNKALVMTSRHGDILHLSVSDPDLNSYLVDWETAKNADAMNDGYKSIQDMILTKKIILWGEYEIQNPNIMYQVVSSNCLQTVIEVKCLYGETQNIILTPKENKSITDTHTACGSFTWIDGNTYTTSNNTATHTLTNSLGCDSVVTLNLTIRQPTSHTDTLTACASYTWIDGNTYTTSNNSATHTLTNSLGCDSVVTLNLTIRQPTSHTDTLTACASYTWIDGNIYTTSNNTATHTLTNSLGCDSVVTLNLTINTTDVSTSIDGTTISANNLNSTYQWIDCNNNHQPITGETKQSFSASTNGNYAVQITEDNCTDTSSCVNITVLETADKNKTNDIVIYPNPVYSKLTIEFSNMTSSGTVSLFDASGKLVMRDEFKNQKTLFLNMENLSQGEYSVQITTNKENSISRVIKLR